MVSSLLTPLQHCTDKHVLALLLQIKVPIGKHNEKWDKQWYSTAPGLVPTEIR